MHLNSFLPHPDLIVMRTGRVDRNRNAVSRKTSNTEPERSREPGELQGSGNNDLWARFYERAPINI